MLVQLIPANTAKATAEKSTGSCGMALNHETATGFSQITGAVPLAVSLTGSLAAMKFMRPLTEHIVKGKGL